MSRKTEKELFDAIRHRYLNDPEKIVASATVLHEGWEMDNQIWLVSFKDGTCSLMNTSHGGVYPCDEDDLDEHIEETQSSLDELKRLKDFVLCGLRKTEIVPRPAEQQPQQMATVFYPDAPVGGGGWDSPYVSGPVMFVSDLPPKVEPQYIPARVSPITGGPTQVDFLNGDITEIELHSTALTPEEKQDIRYSMLPYVGGGDAAWSKYSDFTRLLLESATPQNSEDAAKIESLLRQIAEDEADTPLVVG